MTGRMKRQLFACGLLLTLLAGCTGQSPVPDTTALPVPTTTAPLTFTPTRAETSTAAPTPTTATSRTATSEPATPTPVTSSAETVETGVVTRVYDGDTITVNLDTTGVDEQVRILGIDAPERENKGLGITGECYGEQSADDLRAKLVNVPVRLTVDPEQGDPQHQYRDKYDRLLRYVSALTNGADLDVGAYQLQAGNAWVYEEFPVKKTPDYMRIMATAQDDHTGLWAACE